VLSILLARQQYYGKVPSQTNYAAFTGALGIIAATIGFASMFIDRLKGIISWVLDGVTAIALLAAGIVCYALYPCAFRKSNIPSHSEVEAYF
jgi:hypothetical protein